MISDILNYLNAQLPNIAAVSRPLCQLVTEVNKNGEPRTFPAIYEGNGSLDYVSRFDWKGGMMFWLKNGAEDIELLDRIRANKERVQITIPLKFHWVGSRSVWQNDTQYLEQYILLAIQKAVSFDNIPSLRSILGLDRIKTIVRNRQYGIETIGDVFEGIDLRLPLDMGAAMLEVDLVITGDMDCIVGDTCATPGGVAPISCEIDLVRKHDFVSPYSYCGTAFLGTPTSQATWTIFRIQVNNNGSVVVLEATNVAWDNRLSVIYT